MVKFLLAILITRRGLTMKNNVFQQWSNVSIMIIVRVIVVITTLRVIACLPLYFLVPGLIILFAVLYFIIPKWFTVINDQ